MYYTVSIWSQQPRSNDFKCTVVQLTLIKASLFPLLCRGKMADKLHSIHLFYNFISILFVLSLLNVVADEKNILLVVAISNL